MPIGVPVVNDEGQWTFLQIVQRYVQDCGIAHTFPLQPTTVLNQVGEMRRAVDNCCEAWFDLQQLHADWRFKRHSFSLPLVQGTFEYNYRDALIVPGTFGRWVLNSLRMYRPLSGFQSEIPIYYMDYEIWRDTYQLNALRSMQSHLIHFTLLPNDGLGFGPVPIDGLTVVGDYYTAPIRMEADNNVPELPYKHSPMLIVYEAMLTYGFFEAAPEVIARATQKRKELLNKLELDQLPSMMLTGPLA